MLNTRFSPWPSFTSEEIDAVTAVLRSNRVNYWTGEECRLFEREFAEFSGTAHAIALANGTLALDLALRGLRIGAVNGGNATDEVIVTPRTFIASISCVVNAGAIPVFADVDPDSGNLSPATIEAALTQRTRAVIAVHLAGWPADIDGMKHLTDPRGIRIVEDCAQAHGARIGDRSVGGIGDIGAWSFCQDKIITTGGEGGMVTVNDPALWSRMWSFKDHGKSWEAVYERQHPPGFRWLHEEFGTNWRMLEMQAAIGRIQLRRLPAWTARRQQIAGRIRDALKQFAEIVRVPVPEVHLEHAYYKLYAYVRPQRLKPDWDRDRIISEVTIRGIPLYHGGCSEVYLEKSFDDTGWRPTDRLPVARELGDTSLMFLTHPTLTDDEVEETCTVIGRVLTDAAG